VIFSTLGWEGFPSLSRQSRQPEVTTRARTIAEALIEEGRKQGELQATRETLLLLLREQFKRVPAAIEAEINATQDLEQFEAWLREFAPGENTAPSFRSRLEGPDRFW
jgi:hypothetical protein